ncbi:Ubiquitin carboxyl-terminal hydrolase 6 [Rhodotorula toruloides]|uniref:Ubiquitin carboxyl-terminal hydrolase n=1 Tax=Rhodotorula toruloides TaxID=5286 RepID=A0A0K3CP40_RHOTO|nr:Ubiquitin carboxyl-terminal hydrolase 6 [Rhodotorula toruloides]PRQ71063.1 ubiquitin C-terminal hydrolase [Rhodotorula toruloides]
MAPFAISLKHAGKTYDLKDFDPSNPATVFKDQVYQLTGVPTDKLKIPVKGGMLKDDADLNKLGFKPGQTVMVIGPAGPIPQAPSKPIVFMEDMTDVELAQSAKYPVGLQNLGNTCYMNSTVQVLRAIPELQTALNGSQLGAGQPDAQLTRSLRDLYQSMGRTTEGFPPLAFLSMLRQFAPQFAEQSRQHGGYAQQDAQEAWGAIVQAARMSSVTTEGGNFVERMMTGEFEKTLKSAEAPEEEPTVSKEQFLEVKCNISGTTNYMMQGISESMEQDIEKNSPSLGRQAVYHETTRISRLPSYLTVHMVRFYWRRDINKKTKIMRKVKFPFDLDVTELLTDDLKRKILPVNEKLKDFDKDRRERTKARRKMRKQAEQHDAAAKSGETAAAAPAQANPSDDSPEQMLVDAPASTAGELPDEETKRQEELATLMSLVHPDLEADKGANVSGLYELAGIVTHKGASADGGHYVGWCAANPNEGKEGAEAYDFDPDKQEWYKFDDDKVSLVSKDKILALEGGGEDHSAYILLYRSKSLA